MAGKPKRSIKASRTRAGDIEVPQLLSDIVRSGRETPMAVVRDTIILEANEAWAALFGGKSAEQFRGLDGSVLATPESLAVARQRFSERRRGELVSGVRVYDATRLDGKPLRVEISAVPWPADPSITLSIARDVTEQEQSFENLRRSEQLYKTVADTLPAGVIFRDQSGRVVYVNRQVTVLTGYGREEVAEGRIINSLDEESRRIWQDALTRGVAVAGREMAYTRKDGSKGWMLGGCQPVRDAKGLYLGMCIAFIDITDRKSAEEALQAKTTELEALLRAFPDIYFRLDSSCKILNYWTGREEDLYVPPEKFLGRQLEEVVPKRVASAFKSAVAKVLKTGSMTTIEYRLSIKGRMQIFQARISPFGDGVVVAIGNVTEHRQAERALAGAHQDLEKAYELQREFLSSVTHDIRSPLTAVVGYADILLERIPGPLNAEQERMLKKVIESSKSLLKLVDELLEMARTQRTAMLLHPSEFRPWRLVANTVGVFVPHAESKGLSISLKERHTVDKGVYDKEKLRSILYNLLSNAIKFTETGGIEVVSNLTEAGLEVIIADTGIGIPEDGLRAIFGEFTQLEQPREKRRRGFGLGLSIVARMVETIRGGLIVSSEEGLGTAFTLFAPNLGKDAVQQMS